MPTESGIEHAGYQSMYGIKFEDDESIFEVVEINDAGTIVTCKVTMKNNGDEQATKVHFEDPIQNIQELVDEFSRNGFTKLE